MFHDLRKYFCVTRIVQYLQGTLMYSKDHVKHGCTSGHGLTTRVPAQISSSSQVWKWSRSVVSDSVPPDPIPLGYPGAPALGALLHALNLHWSSVLHVVMYMFHCYSLKSSLPHLLSLSWKVCSVRLCLLCFLACRIVATVFLNSIYRH